MQILSHEVYPCMSLPTEVSPVPLRFLTLLFIHMYIHTLLILYVGHISYAHTAASNRSPYVQKFHVFVMHVHFKMYLIYYNELLQ